MRAAPLTLALLALLLPASAAQEDECSQSAPCPWILDVDEDGIHGDDMNATVDDWYYIQASNLDLDEDHTLTLEGHGVELTVPALGEATSDPIQFGTPGVFSLEDQPTGDSVWLEVRETDVVDDETGGDGDDGADDADTPMPLAVGLAALLAAVVLRRR